MEAAVTVVAARQHAAIECPVLLTVREDGGAQLIVTRALASDELRRLADWVAAINRRGVAVEPEAAELARQDRVRTWLESTHSKPLPAAPSSPLAAPYEGTVSPGALVREDDMSWWFDPCPSCGARTRARVESRSEGGRTLPRVLRCTAHLEGLGRCRAWMNYGVAESTWKARRRAARREGVTPPAEAAAGEPETTEEGDDGSADSAV